MVNSEPLQSEWVLEKIQEVKGVIEAYRVYGVYDIIAVVKAESNNDLKRIVLHIRTVKHIISTTVLMVVE